MRFFYGDSDSRLSNCRGSRNLWRWLVAVPGVIRRLCFCVLALCSCRALAVWQVPPDPVFYGSTGALEGIYIPGGAGTIPAGSQVGYSTAGWTAGAEYSGWVGRSAAAFGRAVGGTMAGLARAYATTGRVLGPAASAIVVAQWLAQQGWVWDAVNGLWQKSGVMAQDAGPGNVWTYSADYYTCHVTCGAADTACADSCKSTLTQYLLGVQGYCGGLNGGCTFASSGGVVSLGGNPPQWAQYYDMVRSDGSHLHNVDAIVMTRRTACATGNWWNSNGGYCSPDSSVPIVPATDQQFQDAISAGLGANPTGMGPPVWQAAQGSPSTFIPDATPTLGWGGPSSLPGDSSTTTTTGPSGVTTTTRVDGYVFDYGSHPDGIGVQKTTTTTTTNPDGSTSTSSTTTSGTATSTGSGGSSNQPPTDVKVCSGDAKGSSACAGLDDLPDTPLTTQPVSVSFSASSTSGSCPVPIVLTMRGKSFSLKWDSICQLATGVAPIVRALGALSAGLWLIAMFRRS